MVLLKSTLLLAALAYQVNAFNYNVTVSTGDSKEVCVEVLGDSTEQNVYPVKCGAKCGEVDNNGEFNAGQCDGTTGADVFAHVNSQDDADYVRIGNQFNYRFPCEPQSSSSSSKTFLCQGWIDPPSSDSSSAASYVTFTTSQSSTDAASATSEAASSTSEVASTTLVTTSVPTVVPVPTSVPASSESSESSASSENSASSTITATVTSTIFSTSSSSAAPSASASSGSCIQGSKGKGLGDGYKGYCCSSNDDCYNSCKSGQCNGPDAPPSTPTVTPTNCKKGTEGQLKGNGVSGDCCYSSADCKESCVNGTCNDPPAKLRARMIGLRQKRMNY